MSVHSLSMDETRVLRKQRIYHMHTKAMGRTSKLVNGLTPFYSDNDLYGCDVLLTYNMRRTASVNFNTKRDALKVKQEIRLDWDFMMHKLHDK